jgi:hypothetical protein
MQIVQSQLGLKSSPLGANSSSELTSNFLQRKSSLLQSINFIKPLIILQPLLASAQILGESSKYLRSWDNFNTILNTDLLHESTTFKFEDLNKNLKEYPESLTEKPKEIKKKIKNTDKNTGTFNQNLTSSESRDRKTTKSKKQTKPQSKAKSAATSKKVTKKSSAKNVEPLDSNSTDISPQSTPALPTVTTSSVDNKLQLKPLPNPLTTTPPSVENELTQTQIAQASIIQPQTTQPSPPSTLDAPPKNSITETQATLRSQAQGESTSTDISPQSTPVPPTDISPNVDNKLPTAPQPNPLTTTPPTVENEPTLRRQSVNNRQEIAPTSPTLSSPETHTTVDESNVGNHLTTEEQIIQPSQPKISDVPNTATTETQITQPSLTQAQTTQPSPPSTLDAPPKNSITETQATLRSQAQGESTSTDISPQSTPVPPTDISPNVDNKLPTAPQADAQTTTPPTGYAIGGQVTTTQSQNSQSIAPSDIVPAMLTPGEFVINAQDTQKNLNLLEHINSGGELENFISRKEIPNSQDEEKLDSDTNSTHADSSHQSLIQRGSLDDALPTTSHTLISSSIGQEIVRKQSLSKHNFIQTSTKDNNITKSKKKSQQYSLPDLVFQQPLPVNKSPSETPPSQWSSIEELLGSSTTDRATAFDSEPIKSSRGNSQHSTISKSPKTTISQKPVSQGFAKGGKVTASNKITSSNQALPSDIDTEAQPITETIKSFSDPSITQDKMADEIETLAREIYNRLRQKLEIERERYGHGMYSGRLPW